MKLSPKILIEKFSFLKKFEDQKWISEIAAKHDCNHKEIPLKATLELINDLIDFIDKTKFNSNWEQGFSIKVRLSQVKSLLLYFCEDNIEESTKKGSNLQCDNPNQQ